MKMKPFPLSKVYRFIMVSGFTYSYFMDSRLNHSGMTDKI